MVNYLFTFVAVLFCTMNIGHNVKKIREFKNLKQEYVAREIGVSRRYYIMMENDEVEIKLERLDLIAKVLNVDINELNFFDDKKIFNPYQIEAGKQQESVLHIQKENLKREKEAFEKQRELYEKLLQEKDFRIRTLEESIREIRESKRKK